MTVWILHGGPRQDMLSEKKTLQARWRSVWNPVQHPVGIMFYFTVESCL